MTAILATYTGLAQPVASLLLEQEPLAPRADSLGAADVVAMYRAVVSGRSARSYRVEDCPASLDGDTVSLELGLRVLPSDMDLDYTLEALPGLVGPGVATSFAREFDLVVDMTDRVELGFLADGLELLGSTPYYDGGGRVIPAPRLYLSGTALRLSSPCFAVLRLRCQALGYSHSLSISVDRQAGYSMDNFQGKAQATWLSGGELQASSLDLELPDCLAQLLNSCDDGSLVGRGRINDPGERIPVVMYSQCTGQVLGVRYE